MRFVPDARWLAETPEARWLRKIRGIDSVEEMDAWKQWLKADGTVLPVAAAEALLEREVVLIKSRLSTLRRRHK